jgi:hypothetical protein
VNNTSVLPTFLYGSENWTLTVSQRRKIEAAGMKLLRPLSGYTLYDHKTNDSIRRELQTKSILDKIDEHRWNWVNTSLAKNATKPNPFKNHTTTDHKEGEHLEDRRNIGGSSCNCGNGTDQRVQPLMFMMMMIIVNTSTEISLTRGTQISHRITLVNAGIGG